MFEFDPAKSKINADKHGIDFDTAQALWSDPDLLTLGKVEYGGEARHLFVGRIGERCWTAIVTYRDGRTRIISVRRARGREEVAYQRDRVRPDVR